MVIGNSISRRAQVESAAGGWYRTAAVDGARRPPQLHSLRPKCTMATVHRALRSVMSLLAVGAVTVGGRHIVPDSPTTVGFMYLLVVLIIASTWGFVEAAVAAVAGALCFNYYFFPPLGTLTIADPLNWIALLSFLITALITSRLSAKAEQRARDAMDRQKDLERLYSFSRAILLVEGTESFPREMIGRLTEIFDLEGVLLYDRRTADVHRAGPAEDPDIDERIRDAALGGGSYVDGKRT